ncbi:hypothetical protein [Peribacillus asahii]|uniref:hypothetical protein n=1 Tax=Peribacillus asahii TaxID=228899 RepID=UPI00207ACF6D|nr:hypothetical protein [Peribacillus asahii]USK84787.1 hypothetical protein LIT35_20750 [Peribacillus asahii]
MGIKKSIIKQHELRMATLRHGGRLSLYTPQVDSEVVRRYQYERLTEILFIFFEDDFRYRVEEFHEALKQYRAKHWKDFHALLEEVFNEVAYSGTKLKHHSSYLTHKNIKFAVKSYRQCQMCGCVFYCLESNGKTNVCSDSCRSRRDNASKSGTTELKYDGQFTRLSPASRKKRERELFLYYNPVADNDESPEWEFFQKVMSQPLTMQGFGDPQDIVCGTPTTHRPYSSHTSKMPILRTKDTGGSEVFNVCIKTGERTVKGSFVTFEKNILEIKDKLPKTPRNPL